MRRKLLLAGVAAPLVVLVAFVGWGGMHDVGASTTPVTGTPTAATTAFAALPATGHVHTVTLLTGDQVALSATGTAKVTPGKGREKVRFETLTVKGHLYVIPQDALRLVANTTMDRRLFDITLLVSLGYDDTHRTSLPLIVQYKPGRTGLKAAATLGAAGARKTRDLPAVHAAAVSADKHRTGTWPALVTAPKSAHAALAVGLGRVWLDGRRQPALDQSVPQIGAPAAWTAGYTGVGVSVAVIDTGIDTAHPDLVGKVADERNFTTDPASDMVGHGTHVASTIAGTGAASAGRYKGVAPDATLYDAKVCGRYGCDESAILAGMQWAAADKHARVVNLSLGGPDMPDIDPLEQAVNTLTAQYGTLFVVASGNAGPADGTVGSPGSADAALTVGAVDQADQLAIFSSRGPRVGDDGVKPDITAPGVGIVAAKAADAVIGEPVGDRYLRLSGTSMATPHVAGAAAILAQQHPQWTASELKADLMASAKPNPASTGYQQGAGRVDLARAITQSVTTEPTSLSLGRTSWPHTDDTPITRTLTYRNSASTDITLDLTVQVTAPGGAAVPAGMFTPNPSHITVSAGGTAQVLLTTDTRVVGPDGLYSGQLIATSGAVAVSTPIGVNKEVESHDLTLSIVDRDGAPTDAYFVAVADMAGSAFIAPYDPSGTVRVRLPKSRYDLSVGILTGLAGPAPTLTLLSQPVLDLGADTTVTLDARRAGGLAIGVPDPTAQPVLAAVGYDHAWPGGGAGNGLFGESSDGMYFGPVGGPEPGTGYIAHASTEWATPGPDGTRRNSPVTYNTGTYQYGQLYNGYQRQYRKGEFAKVKAGYAAVLPGDVEATFAAAAFPQVYFTVAHGLLLDPPVRQTGYYAGDAGVSWRWQLMTGTVTPDGLLASTSLLSGDSSGLRAGETYEQHWNEGPFSVSFPRTGEPRIGRFGDTIEVFTGMFGDRAGHSGDGNTDTASTTLYLDGQVIGQSPYPGAGDFPVPAATGTYRLVVETTRSGYTDLTTSSRTEWTFRSGHTPEDALSPLPVFVVRPTPELVNNAAPAGQRFEIPIAVQYQAGLPVGSVNTLAVQVSYDDGRTWQTAIVRHNADGWTAVVEHPRAAGYVSLRMTASDTAGSTVDETVIHAYRLTTH